MQQLLALFGGPRKYVQQLRRSLQLRTDKVSILRFTCILGVNEAGTNKRL